LEIVANAFLHHMVRNMVGVLLIIGRGLKPMEFAEEILHKRNRSHGIMTAPPSGLYLSQVYFEGMDLPATNHYPWFLQQLSLQTF
ncbi:MAG TPA: tRNA pseudouridine(38-40) synthase TruA, partial [Gammaproteobacteria bacterium]|nr:tRNA pseudouridine(38-40) synthase TruA [Gammaproteobacteria bacterium]